MSDAMFAAIRKRKMSGHSVMGDHEAQGHKGYHDDKANEDDGKGAQDVSKGGPSTHERNKIQEKMSEDSASEQMQDAHAGNENDQAHAGGPDRDSIAKDFLDSKFRNGPREDVKPRNLNDRMQMNAAKHLKEKGKL